NGNSSSQSSMACARTPAAGGAPNDNFGSRLTYFSTVTDASNQGATKEPGEPAHAGNAGGKSVWWSWTAPASEDEVVISTLGSSFDTLLAVYIGSSIGGLTPVASNDNDMLIGPASSVHFFPTPGATYLIAVDGKDGAAGNIRLNITLCASAIYPLTADFGATGGNGSVNVGTSSG